MYSKALSLTEVGYLYDADGDNPGTATLEAHWTFDGDLRDQTSNDNDGTFYGGFDNITVGLSDDVSMATIHAVAVEDSLGLSDGILRDEISVADDLLLYDAVSIVTDTGAASVVHYHELYGSSQELTTLKGPSKELHTLRGAK